MFYIILVRCLLLRSGTSHSGQPSSSLPPSLPTSGGEGGLVTSQLYPQINPIDKLYLMHNSYFEHWRSAPLAGGGQHPPAAVTLHEENSPVIPPTSVSLPPPTSSLLQLPPPPTPSSVIPHLPPQLPLHPPSSLPLGLWHTPQRSNRGPRLPMDAAPSPLGGMWGTETWLT